MYEPCAFCKGSGRIKSAESISVELQRKLSGLLRMEDESISDLVVVVHPEVMQRLKDEDSKALLEMERRHHGRTLKHNYHTYFSTKRSSVDYLCKHLR